MIKILLIVENEGKEMYVPALPRKGEIFRFKEMIAKDFIVDSVIYVGDGEMSFEAHVYLLPL
jgi:hypothetical protein